jgi:uncharacterized protein YndB with AHSA1/START domain
MTLDVERHLGAVKRTVSALERDGKPARCVTLSRLYDTTVDDLWDAVTNPERLPRWFLPVEGDLRLGGRYQLKGNAGGSITVCAPPTQLDLTWEFGGDTSWVEVRLAGEGAERARLTLNHIAHVSDHWRKFGPGAVGVGWELGLLGLALHLADRTAAVALEEADLATRPEGRALILGSAEAWGEADIESGEDPVQARSAARRTGAFYTGSPPPED